MARTNRVSLERKRELEKPDRFMIFLQKIGDYAVHYRRQLLTAAVVVFLAVAVVAAVGYFREKSARTAFFGLAEITAPAAESASEYVALQEQKHRYLSFYEKHRRSLAGRIAGLKYADACMKTGDTEAAIEAYQRAVADFKGRELFYLLALSGLGYAWEEAGRYEEAARCFREIVDHPRAANKDLALFNLGRMYDLMGESGESRDVFAGLAEEYPSSLYAPLAASQLSG